jgi:hypothetical protein
MVDIQGVKFPGYGRCIYCGSTGPLKDEHIIPFSLGGKAVIEAASCGDCEKVTSYLDGYLARQIFHEYRAHAGMKSRRPKGAHPNWPPRSSSLTALTKYGHSLPKSTPIS